MSDALMVINSMLKHPDINCSTLSPLTFKCNVQTVYESLIGKSVLHARSHYVRAF